MLTVTVERSKWYRGLSSVGSRLLRKDGQMCCLGFASIAAGCTKEQIIRVGQPRPNNAPGLALPALVKNNEVLECMVSTNDTPYLNEDQRESKLTRLGLQVDINFSFVD